MTAGLAAAYAWQAVALTALVTVLGRPNCVRRWGDYRGHLLYFGFFFLLLAVVPAAWLGLGRVTGPGSLGLTLGKAKLGLALLAAAVPVVVLLLVGVMRDPTQERQCPLSPAATRMRTGFVLYEAVYLLGYYTAWEFTFRGLLFLPLVPVLGLVPALAIQTVLSTLMHIGRPGSEVWGAAAGGVALGLIAHYTGSIVYPFIIHAGLGVAHDALRRRRLLRDG